MNTDSIVFFKDSGTVDAEACRDAETEIENCGSMGEAVIILKHLFAFCLEQGFIAAKAISDKKVRKLFVFAHVPFGITFSEFGQKALLFYF